MKKRLTKEELERVKSHAKILYTREGLTLQKELAQRVGVSENTISKWVIEGKWESLKKNFLLTREERMSDLLDELTEIQEFIKNQPEGRRFADSKLGDVRRKLIKDIKELETNASREEIIHALTKLIQFVRPENLNDARIITQWADVFIKTLLR
ncbi:transcriptional regulator [Pedobacter sp. BS3]|uniref:YfeC-like transcriptional regulator n=1 Tax=Pedobacter sp. BS3 TaxID=2567937 RepID=UPI0011F0325B|nr:transcriptional regulator [Pedobacter sp. BS3]TZF81812.1 transcriptional regulator [Pedobacter sp. BS3]